MIAGKLARWGARKVEECRGAVHNWRLGGGGLGRRVGCAALRCCATMTEAIYVGGARRDLIDTMKTGRVSKSTDKVMAVEVGNGVYRKRCLCTVSRLCRLYKHNKYSVPYPQKNELHEYRSSAAKKSKNQRSISCSKVARSRYALIIPSKRYLSISVASI
jgi:hypothetical protein